MEIATNDNSNDDNSNDDNSNDYQSHCVIDDSLKGNGLDCTEWNGIDEMVSLCMACGENGVTRMMLHKIPSFRELIIASFECEHCGERNNEVTFGGEIQLLGSKFSLKVISEKDLDRQVVKSDSASVYIPEIDFEIPPGTQKGEISTIEGFLRQAANNLGLYQDARMEQTPEIGIKVAEIIGQLMSMAMGETLPFNFIVNDIAGNSFVENPYAPKNDSNMIVSHFKRSAAEDISLGLEPEKGSFKDDKDGEIKTLIKKGFGSKENNGSVNETEDSVRLGRQEIISLPGMCPNCSTEGESLTAITDIPHFKEVIIMAFDCNFCGFRNNEVKAGGAVPNKGTEVRLVVQNLDDMKRDVLKSDSCSVSIPELDLELQNGTLGGLYTTVEGLLHKIYTNLRDNNPFAIGDSTELHHSAQPTINETKERFNAFMTKLDDYSKGKNFPFILSLRDPLGNCFISAPLGSFLPPEADENLTLIDFERTYEENEDFGLNDINTKDFETGVDYDEVILPDRLTHKSTKGADHPTFFAKGMDDSTPGGACLTDSIVLETSSSNKVAQGWTATPQDDDTTRNEVTIMNEEVYTSKRVFSVDDKLLKHIPREEFGGRKEGYIFRLGLLGLGYYEDKNSSL